MLSHCFYIASEGGIGLNFDILETNIINLAIIIGVLYVYVGKFITKALSDRQDRIASEIKEAEQRLKDAQSELSTAKKSLEEAQATAKTIKAEAEINAAKSKEAILAAGQKEVEKLQAAAVKELDSQQTQVALELKQRIANLVVAELEGQFAKGLDDSLQSKLIDRNIEQLK